MCQVTPKCKQQNKTEKTKGGTSLAVQWLRLHTSNAVGLGSIPGQEAKMSHAVWHSQRRERTQRHLDAVLDGAVRPGLVGNHLSKDLNEMKG